MKTILESSRLYFREMTEEDAPVLAAMLQDPEVMYAWGRTFSDEEVCAWIRRMQSRYREDGYAYWLAVDRNRHEAVGQIGLLNEEIHGRFHLGVGWILRRNFFHCGYAAEGGGACLEHAFHVRRAQHVIADIRPMNTASIRVAERLGMTNGGSYDKIVNGERMEHRIYWIGSPLMPDAPPPDFLKRTASDPSAVCKED